MIKNITFGGITRIPSAKIIEQGECSESLNVQIDNHEIVPMPKPKQANKVLGLPNTVKGDVLYIHKGNGYLNTIVLLTDEETGTKNIGYYVKVTNPTTHITKYNFVSIFSIDADDKIFDITSVGNTLVFSSGKKMFYVLFKGGEYEFLGNQVPAPDIVLVAKEVNDGIIETSGVKSLSAPWATNKNSDINLEQRGIWEDHYFIDTGSNRLNLEKIEDAFQAGQDINKDNNPTEYAFLASIHRMISAMTEDDEKNGIYNYPVWATVGFRLFDNTVLCTTPVLLGTKCGRQFFDVKAVKTAYWGTDNGLEYNLSVQWYNAYKIYYQIKKDALANIQKWKDIILSIDIYTSPLIGVETESQMNANIVESETEFRFTYYSTGAENYVTEKKPLYSINFYNINSSFESLYIDGVDNLYLKKRINVDEVLKQKERQAYEVTSNGITRYGNIAAFETLQNAIFDYRNQSYGELMNINNRVLATNMKKFIGSMTVPPAHVTYLWKQRKEAFVSYFGCDSQGHYRRTLFDTTCRTAENLPILPTGNSGSYSLAINHYDDTSIMTKHASYLEGEYYAVGDGKEHEFIIYTLPIIPFSNVKTIDIMRQNFDDEWRTVYNLEMKQHSYWDIVYYAQEMEYNGKQVFTSEIPLYDFVDKLSTYMGALSPETEKNFIETTNKLYLSEVDSAFSFPIENNYTMPGDIIGVAAASTALSEGQFGNFPLYVFTTQGVYAMSLNSEGTFNGASLVTREIAYKGTITSVDQAVVFVSDKGVMLLTGSQLKCLSSELDGKTYTIGEDIKQIFTDNRENSLVALLDELDDMPFIDFVKNASSTYDYVNGRIIFFNKEKNYQYVYRFDTGTWHKMSQIWYKDNKPMSLPSPIPFTRVLNSYPDALVVFDAGDSSIVYNFSQRLIQQDEFATTSKGIIVTRPIDCDNPNGYDALKRLRVRGIFQNNEDGSVSHPVKYLLLASNDGVNFTLLHSTRGGSWKYFRLVVLCDLKSTDRLSYITMETEQRYNNKVR